MISIFRCVAEADEIKVGHCLVVMFNRIAKSDLQDWVGSIYVKAISESEAKRRFTDFLISQASNWSFQGEVERLDSLRDYELDYEVMSGRGDIQKLLDGEVVIGCGM